MSQFVDLIRDYQSAWPIINALQKQGTQKLIPILEAADESALSALRRVADDANFCLLLDTFLAKNSAMLASINRGQLIQFLRQPDFSNWLRRCLSTLEAQAAHAMSSRFLLLAFSSGLPVLDVLAELRATLAAYPFSIHKESMWSVCKSYTVALQKDLFSAVSHHFVLLFHDFFLRADVVFQIDFIKGLNQECLLLIIEHCLRECGQSNSDLQPSYVNLLYQIASVLTLSGNEYSVLVQARFNQFDAHLYDSPELEQLATQLLNQIQESSPANQIAQLLRSPEFVAVSSPKVLKQLKDRYLLCTMMDDKTSVYGAEFQLHLDRIEQMLSDHPEATAYWLQKKIELLRSCIESTCADLFFELEQICYKQNKEDMEGTHKALEVLYKYYAATYKTLRFDLLLRAMDFAYRQALQPGGPFESSHNLLMQWLRQFCSIELDEEVFERKKEVSLYDAAGSLFGFLSEANQVMVFVDEAFIPLVDTGAIIVDEPVYTSSGVILGHITASGHLKSESPLQKNIGMLLLGQISEEELEQSPYGLNLLLRHVLFELSFDVKDMVNPGSAKHQWLGEQLSGIIKASKEEYPEETLSSLISKFDDEIAFELLAEMPNRANALHVFHAILNQESTRTLLFQGLNDPEFQAFLGRHGSVFCFADFMIQFYNAPWFEQGLLCFARHAIQCKHQGLLTDALALLFNEGAKTQEHLAQCNDLVACLLGIETCAAIVLKQFFRVQNLASLKQAKHHEVHQLTYFVNKSTLLVALRTLNKSSAWNDLAQYQLVLHVFDQQLTNLFPAQASHNWSKDELNEVACFINRHLRSERTFDKTGHIGHRVMGELIFKTASAGLTSLFYEGTTFTYATARLSFTRHFLERLVDKFWMPQGIKEVISDEVSRWKVWRGQLISQKKERKDAQVLFDWHHLIHQTWHQEKNTKLPAICVFLLHYSGPKQPLLILLRDYIHAFQKEVDYLHPLARLLRQFPNREVSGVIFDALVTAIIRTPSILDRRILKEMAVYFNHQNSNSDQKPMQAEINLLRYFGLNKYYPVVHRGCGLLATACEDKGLKKSLMQGVKEAQVEAELNTIINQFYFSLVKFIKRIWYYGFNVTKNASGLVSFCDDPTPGPTHKRAADEIVMPDMRKMGNSALLSFAEKRTQFIGLLEAIRASSGKATSSDTQINTRHGLFAVHKPLKEVGLGSQLMVQM